MTHVEQCSESQKPQGGKAMRKNAFLAIVLLVALFAIVMPVSADEILPPQETAAPGASETPATDLDKPIGNMTIGEFFAMLQSWWTTFASAAPASLPFTSPIPKPSVAPKLDVDVAALAPRYYGEEEESLDDDPFAWSFMSCQDCTSPVWANWNAVVMTETLTSGEVVTWTGEIQVSGVVTGNAYTASGFFGNASIINYGADDPEATRKQLRAYLFIYDSKAGVWEQAYNQEVGALNPLEVFAAINEDISASVMLRMAVPAFSGTDSWAFNWNGENFETEEEEQDTFLTSDAIVFDMAKAIDEQVFSPVLAPSGKIEVEMSTMALALDAGSEFTPTWQLWNEAYEIGYTTVMTGASYDVRCSSASKKLACQGTYSVGEEILYAGTTMTVSAMTFGPTTQPWVPQPSGSDLVTITVATDWSIVPDGVLTPEQVEHTFVYDPATGWVHGE